MLDEPLRPQTVSVSPWLRSALAAGECEPDSRADDELDALFGVDDEMEIAGEHRGEATGAVPSPDPGEEAEIQTEGRDPVILREPIRPSAEAVDKHNAIICVSGPGVLCASKHGARRMRILVIGADTRKVEA